jgi:hypothetical protein
LTNLQFSCARATRHEGLNCSGVFMMLKSSPEPSISNRFLGSRPSAFSFPVIALPFRLTADQFDWQTRPTPHQQEIS